MVKIVKLTQNGVTVHPATTTRAVVDSDFRVPVNKLVEDINVSKLFPTGGLGSTNKYTLEGAIAKIPVAYRTPGVRCLFIRENNETARYEYIGGDYLNNNSWTDIGAKAIDKIRNNNLLVFGDERIGFAVESIVADFTCERIVIYQYINRKTAAEYVSQSIGFHVYVKGIKYDFAFGHKNLACSSDRETIKMEFKEKERTLILTAVVNWGAKMNKVYALIKDGVECNMSLVKVPYDDAELASLKKDVDSITTEVSSLKNEFVINYKGIIEI